MDMAGSTVSVVKGAVKYVGRGLAVFALEVKMTGQLLTGQDITKNYDFCHIGGATVQNVSRFQRRTGRKEKLFSPARREP